MSVHALGAALERLGRELQALPVDNGLGFVDVDELAYATAVRAAVRAGALRGHRVGRKLLVHRDELVRWIAAQPAGMGAAVVAEEKAPRELTEAEKVVAGHFGRSKKRKAG